MIVIKDVKFTTNSKVELINHTGGDESVARAAWVSTVGEDARTKDTDRMEGLINFLYRNKHLSPFEHNQFTFFIQTPIFVAREFHRHRTFSYNEMSGRYMELGPMFYLPPTARPLVQEGKVGNYNFVPGDTEQATMTEKTIRKNSINAWNKYQELKSAGVANEVARMVLPVNLMTNFYASVNARNLMHFLDLRTEGQALYEIRQVANKMESFLKDKMPITHSAYTKGQ